MLLVFLRLYFGIFFFFKQKTAYEMRISDWSSDVCSSDLHGGTGGSISMGGVAGIGGTSGTSNVGGVVGTFGGSGGAGATGGSSGTSSGAAGGETKRGV